MKLDNLLDDYKKSVDTNKRTGNYHIMDDYLIIMNNLRNTKRYKQFFDPLRLRMYLIQPSQQIINHSVPVAEDEKNYFLKGCRAYLQSDFQNATAHFRKIDDREDPFWYECQFNLATTRFKCGDFIIAHQMFVKLYREMQGGKLQFVGRDRRLFYNKALCELQMGKYDDCLRTCKAYRKPIKELLKLQEIENVKIENQDSSK
jgi:hypothetical protein